MPAVVAAEPGHRHRASTCRWSPAAGWWRVSILDRFAITGPGRDRHRRRPRARRRHRRRARRGRRRRASSPPAPPDQLEEVADQVRATGRRCVVVAGRPQRPRRGRRARADGVRRVRPARHRRQQRRRHLPAAPSSTPARGFLDEAFSFNVSHRARAHPGRGAADAEERRRPAVGRDDQLDDGPHRRTAASSPTAPPRPRSRTGPGWPPRTSRRGSGSTASTSARS